MRDDGNHNCRFLCLPIILHATSAAGRFSPHTDPKLSLLALPAARTWRRPTFESWPPSPVILKSAEAHVPTRSKEGTTQHTKRAMCTQLLRVGTCQDMHSLEQQSCQIIISFSPSFIKSVFYNSRHEKTCLFSINKQQNICVCQQSKHHVPDQAGSP